MSYRKDIHCREFDFQIEGDLKQCHICVPEMEERNKFSNERKWGLRGGSLIFSNMWEIKEISSMLKITIIRLIIMITWV